MLQQWDAARPPGSDASRASLNRRRSDGDRPELAAAAAVALDSLRYGIALIGRDCRVYFINQRGRSLSEQVAGLQLQQGRLVAARAGDAVRLITAVTRIVNGAAGTALHLGCGSARPLSVIIQPLPHAGSWAPEPAMAMVWFTDPARLPPVPRERLMQAYGLTGTEAWLASLLLQGRAVGQIAEQLGIRIATARTHLKAVLAKTATHRQSELIYYLLQEVGWML